MNIDSKCGSYGVFCSIEKRISETQLAAFRAKCPGRFEQEGLIPATPSPGDQRKAPGDFFINKYSKCFNFDYF
jgi:hypothetical protein